ncbi:hypothetical protein [Herminiimonas sp. CN]|uniref:hypothetical protein n=1 Tax=Herminiimonas sp. CN TaxID=1349818 RepID=UPI000473B6D0|nr:hypothetical protein [Herminiimonas sp. CN]
MSDERPYQTNATVSVRPKPVAPAAAASKPLPPLSEAEHARIKQTIAIVKEKCPELVPMIKELHALGMIDGWRSVTITKVNDDTH